MMDITKKYRDIAASVLFGIVVFLFWYVFYPHALSYQEQYQLFLWSGDYFLDAIRVPGGFSDWLGDFVMQFYYVPWIGALMLACIYIAFAWIVGWIPAMLLFWLFGDPAVTLGYVWAVILAQGAFRLNQSEGKKGILTDFAVVPLLYWLAGPLSILYVVLRMTKVGVRGGVHILYLFGVALMAYRFILDQQPIERILTPTLYYRISLKTNSLMWIIPLVSVCEYLILRSKYILERKGKARYFIGIVPCVIVAWMGISYGYDKDFYELIKQDYLARNERWDDIIKNAEDYQVRTNFSSVCVNLALAEKRLLADRMFEFYQSGEDALIMPMSVGDNTSMLPTAEVFWRLGMVNSALRFMFDTQESILNGKLSGRCTKRIAECMLVNGHYKTAAKQIRILKKSLFYSSWAKDAEAMFGNEQLINAHPVYGRIRQIRFREERLYNYREIEEMLKKLFTENPKNTMALDYYMGQLLLKSKIGEFRRAMPMVQQYGAYPQMPRGYADAMNAIASGGHVLGSPYVEYVNRMLQTRKNGE